MTSPAVVPGDTVLLECRVVRVDHRHVLLEVVGEELGAKVVVDARVVGPPEALALISARATARLRPSA